MCHPPKDTRQLRQIDGNFVKRLKQRMLEDPSAPGVPPLAVLCKDLSDKEKFIPHLKDQYEYEVLGGLHTVMAKNNWLKKFQACLGRGQFAYCCTIMVDCSKNSPIMQIKDIILNAWLSYTVDWQMRNSYAWLHATMLMDTSTMQWPMLIMYV